MAFGYLHKLSVKLDALISHLHSKEVLHKSVGTFPMKNQDLNTSFSPVSKLLRSKAEQEMEALLFL